MGYRRPQTVYRLQFAEPEFEGLEVDARSVPLGKVMDLFKLTSLAELDDRAPNADDLQNLNLMFSTFADALVRWNLEEPVDPANEAGPWRAVPATLSGILSQDLGFMAKVVLAWMQAIADVPDGLGKGSTSGPDFPEQSGLTDLSSLSLESLMRPS